MPRAGRKPLPAEVLKLRGEPTRPVPVVVGGRVAPDAPDHLTPNMKTCWQRIVDWLTEADVIDEADAGIIEAAAVAWGRAQDVREALAKEKNALTETTPQGRVANRLLAVERDAWRDFRALAETLPISPWGRARLGLKGNGPVGKSGLEDLPANPRLRAVNE